MLPRNNQAGTEKRIDYVALDQSAKRNTVTNVNGNFSLNKGRCLPPLLLPSYFQNMTDLFFFISYYRQSCFQLKDYKKKLHGKICKEYWNSFYSSKMACAAVDRKRATVTFSLLGERFHVIPLEMEPIKST